MKVCVGRHLALYKNDASYFFLILDNEPHDTGTTHVRSPKSSIPHERRISKRSGKDRRRKRRYTFTFNLADITVHMLCICDISEYIGIYTSSCT